MSRHLAFFVILVTLIGCASMGRKVYSLKGAIIITRGEMEEISRALSLKKQGTFRLASGKKDATCDGKNCELKWVVQKVPVFRNKSRLGHIGKLRIKMSLNSDMANGILNIMSDMRLENGELLYEKNEGNIIVDENEMEYQPRVATKSKAQAEITAASIQGMIKGMLSGAR